jgi:two-component system nitrate/nitrite response regulator NarL
MHQLRVLVADDHQEFRRVVYEFLDRMPNVSVVGEAANGQEAVEQVERLRPDVILMDISMPVMNGLEATKIIKANHPEIRVVIATMHDNPLYRQRAQEVQADGFFVKPQLKENLELMLGSARAVSAAVVGSL